MARLEEIRGDGRDQRRPDSRFAHAGSPQAPRALKDRVRRVLACLKSRLHTGHIRWGLFYPIWGALPQLKFVDHTPFAVHTAQQLWLAALSTSDLLVWGSIPASRTFTFLVFPIFSSLFVVR